VGNLSEMSITFDNVKKICKRVANIQHLFVIIYQRGAINLGHIGKKVALITYKGSTFLYTSEERKILK
jgi:hypothetical protein